MHWPQIITVALYAIHFAVSCEKSGQSRGEYSPTQAVGSIAIGAAILYYGGFFAVWGWAP